MTRKTLNFLIKKAAKKQTAVDKAMNVAAKLGKPTTTGIVSGAGLGAILAAAGALSRSGENPEENSVLSNPLLLGALGATGGYLAGNALDKIPTGPNRKDNNLSLSSIGLLGGGLGTLGTMVSADDIAKNIAEKGREYSKVYDRLPDSIRRFHAGADSFGLSKVDLDKVDDITLEKALKNRLNSLGRSATDDQIKQLAKSLRADYTNASSSYARALRGAGKIDDAILMGDKFYWYGKNPPNKLGWKILDKIRFSKYSPVRWAKAMNPLKGTKLLSQLGRVASRNRTATALAALAALAGGGKAIYDKTRD